MARFICFWGGFVSTTPFVKACPLSGTVYLHLNLMQMIQIDADISYVKVFLSHRLADHWIYRYAHKILGLRLAVGTKFKQ